MRKIMEAQMTIGETEIGQIEFDLRSRDEIPKLLMSLQYIYCNPEIRKKVFSVLEKMVPKGVSTKTGRDGMPLWTILVLGTLRLNCNWDYDKIQDIANNHSTLRQMLGHGTFNKKYYPLQTIKDNVALLTPEISDKISEIVVKAGHARNVKKKII